MRRCLVRAIIPERSWGGMVYLGRYNKKGFLSFFNNDVIISSLVTNLNISTAQETVTTADAGCVHRRRDSSVASASAVCI